MALILKKFKIKTGKEQFSKTLSLLFLTINGKIYNSKITSQSSL
jgi:hypothetical protein